MTDGAGIKHTRGETIDRLCQIIMTGEWWTFIFATYGTGKMLISQIQDKYYKPSIERSQDFGLMIGPEISYAIARKSRMTKEQLAKIFLSIVRPDRYISPRKIEEANNEIDGVKNIFLKSKEDRDVIPILADQEADLNQLVLSAHLEIRDYWDKQRDGT